MLLKFQVILVLILNILWSLAAVVAVKAAVVAAAVQVDLRLHQHSLDLVSITP
jgi:hypothetical protein